MRPSYLDEGKQHNALILGGLTLCSMKQQQQQQDFSISAGVQLKSSDAACDCACWNFCVSDYGAHCCAKLTMVHNVD